MIEQRKSKKDFFLAAAICFFSEAVFEGVYLSIGLYYNGFYKSFGNLFSVLFILLSLGMSLALFRKKKKGLFITTVAMAIIKLVYFCIIVFNRGFGNGFERLFGIITYFFIAGAILISMRIQNGSNSKLFGIIDFYQYENLFHRVWFLGPFLFLIGAQLWIFRNHLNLIFSEFINILTALGLLFLCLGLKTEADSLSTAAKTDVISAEVESKNEIKIKESEPEYVCHICGVPLTENKDICPVCSAKQSTKMMSISPTENMATSYYPNKLMLTTFLGFSAIFFPVFGLFTSIIASRMARELPMDYDPIDVQRAKSIASVAFVINMLQWIAGIIVGIICLLEALS